MIKIGVDIDNVVSNSYPAYLERFNTRFNTNIRFEEIKEFYFLERYIENNIVSNSVEMINFVDEMLLDRDFHLTIKPVDESKRIIADWIKKGFQIHYITLRPVEVLDMTRDWLKKHGFYVKGVKLDLYDHTKGFESDVMYKKEVADKYKLDVFIEDSLDIAQVMEIPVFLLDKPWNQGKLKQNITRVSSWNEIEEKLPKVLKLRT